MILSYLIHSIHSKTSTENFTDKNNKNDTEIKYVSPTFDNPFMNVQYDDYVKNPNRDSISNKNIGDDISQKNIDLQIEEKFNYNLYKDMSDIYDKNNSQRQFYTTPITTIPNDQMSFANWLYNSGPTCKEKNYSKCEMLNYYNLKQSSLYR